MTQPVTLGVVVRQELGMELCAMSMLEQVMEVSGLDDDERDRVAAWFFAKHKRAEP